MRFLDSSGAAVTMRRPLDCCHWGTTRTWCGPDRDLPPRILTENGPNSSIEKNASSCARRERVERISSTLARHSGSVLVKGTLACFHLYPAAWITAPILLGVDRLPCARSTLSRSTSLQLVRLNPWSLGGVWRTANTASRSSSPG